MRSYRKVPCCMRCRHGEKALVFPCKRYKEQVEADGVCDSFSHSGTAMVMQRAQSAISDLLPDADIAVLAADEERLVIGSRKFGSFTWPGIVRYDDRKYWFAEQRTLGMEEAGRFGGKAVYHVRKGNDHVGTEE